MISQFRCQCGKVGCVDVGKTHPNRYPCQEHYEQVRRERLAAAEEMASFFKPQPNTADFPSPRVMELETRLAAAG